MKSIFNIAEEELRLMAEIEANEGELNDELAARLELNETATELKIESYRNLIKELEGIHESISKEVVRLSMKLEANENLRAKLKGNLLQWMELTGRTKYSTPLFTLSARPAKSIKITIPEEELPAEFQVEKVLKRVDKLALKEALKEGRQINGVELVTNYSLQIQ